MAAGGSMEAHAVSATPSPSSILRKLTKFGHQESPSQTTDAAVGGSAVGRRPIVAGNWKLNPTSRDEALSLLRDLADLHGQQGGQEGPGAPEVVVFPPLPYLSDALSALKGTGIKVGAQNAGSHEKGAFTGEIAPSMLTSAGCEYVLLGHSERRTLFGETDSDINSRLKLCLEQPALTVILCVGETLEEYEAGLLKSVVDFQLRKGLAGVQASDLLAGRVVVAYEPVWAIGTGLVATPDQAQAAHVAIRETVAAVYSGEVASSLRIQYGGSVSPDSISDLMQMPDVDGALVGGASLIPDSFTRIIEGAAPASPSQQLASAGVSSPGPGPAEAGCFYHASGSDFALGELTPKGPRKGADVGQPHDATRPLVSVGSVSTGSWWCAEGGWPSPTPRATTEVFYVLSGHACVTDTDETRHFMGPGDLVILPKGWAGRWDVLQDIHKVWVVTDHPEVGPNSGPTHASVTPYSSLAPHHLSKQGLRADAIHGSPSTASHTLHDIGHMKVGCWTCTPGSFPVSKRPTTESFHVLEGVFFLTNADGSARRCVAGDTVCLPKNWSGSWDVIETVKKLWVVVR